MKKVKLRVQSESGQGPGHIIVGYFDDQDIERLNLFVSCMARVRTSALLKRGLPTISNISWNQEKGMVFTCPPYEDGELHELLHVLRPLILQDERVSFHQIAALLGKKFTRDVFRSHLKYLRRMFDHGELNLYMQIHLGETPLFSDSTLKLWLNSEEYHLDKDKSPLWREFAESLTTENTRAFVICQIYSKVKSLFGLEYLVDLVLRDPAGSNPSFNPDPTASSRSG